MNTLLKYSASIALLLFSVCSFAQFDSTWTKIYGGNRDDKAFDIIHTQDSGYLIIGSTSSFDFDNSQMYFLKLDSTGTIQWSKSHGGSNQEAGHSVIQTQDGGYLGVGFTNSWGSGGFDLLLVKLDNQGNTEYESYFGGIDWDFGWDVIEQSTNIFVIAGETQSFGSGGKDAWIVRYDANNDIFDWNKTLGLSGTDDYKSLTLDHTGGFYAAGRGVQSGKTDEDVMITRYDMSGDTMWNKYYGDTSQDYANDILWFSDSSIVFTGCSFIQDTGVAFTVKVGELDTIVWEEKWNQGEFTEGTSILERSDGQPGVFGTYINESINSEFWYIFMGYNGSGTMGSLEDDIAARMIQNHQGLYAMVGTTFGFESNYSNILLYLTEAGTYNSDNTYLISDTSNVLSSPQVSQSQNFKLSYDNQKIRISFEEESNDIQVELFNSIGMRIMHKNVYNQNIDIHSSNYPSAIYFLIISSGSQVNKIPIFISGN